MDRKWGFMGIGVLLLPNRVVQNVLENRIIDYC